MTGILLIDKPEGMTSFVAAARVRRMTGVKKTGHTGTLDPMATGVLPVLLGGATRFCELLPSHDKAYIASLRLGTVTDTLDITGEVLETREVNASRADFESALQSFSGTIEQVPPMYSAISQNGVRLYKLARQGIEVERESRTVNISSISLVGCDKKNGEYTISVECSAGTYIRSLVADIGEKLGCGAVMTALRRTKANGFPIDGCITLDELAELAQSGKIEEKIIPIEQALGSYRFVTVTEPQARRFRNGGELSLERLYLKAPQENELVRVIAPGNEFLGMGEVADGEIKVKRLLIK